MDVGDFALVDGHVTVQLHLHGHTLGAMKFCLEHDDHPGLVSAVEDLRSALADAVTLTMLECAPAVPDAPPLSKPCRICDRRTPDNADDERGMTFCSDHRPKGTP